MNIFFVLHLLKKKNSLYNLKIKIKYKDWVVNLKKKKKKKKIKKKKKKKDWVVKLKKKKKSN